MNFRPPDAYTRLSDLGLIVVGSEFWYDVEWCNVQRWVDHDPERLAKYESTHPIGDYYMFAVTGGGDPWCWHAGVPTSKDEFEIHEVDLFMYLPRAATFGGFLLRKHLEGIVHCESYDDWHVGADNSKILDALLSSDVLAEVRSVEQQVYRALQRGDANPFRWNEFNAVIENRLGLAYRQRC